MVLLLIGSFANPLAVLPEGFMGSSRFRPQPLSMRRKPAMMGFEPTTTKRRMRVKDDGEQKGAVAGPAASAFPVRVSTALISRSAIAVLALGFIDAGYSGDWSRIGVISRDTEYVLRLAAYFVVPLCLYFIVKISVEEKTPGKNK